MPNFFLTIIFWTVKRNLTVVMKRLVAIYSVQIHDIHIAQRKPWKNKNYFELKKHTHIFPSDVYVVNEWGFVKLAHIRN